MKPTQNQLEQLWKAITKMFDINGLETKKEIIDYAEDFPSLAYDILFDCLDIMADSKGKILKL